MKEKGELQLRYRKNLFFLGYVSFFNDLASEMVYPLLPLFLQVKLAAGPFVLGCIEGCAEATASLLKGFSGYFSDRFHRRKGFLGLGYSLSVFLRPLIGLTTHWVQVLLIRFIDRMGKGVRTPPRDALLADSVKPSERGFAFGFQRAMDHLGAVAGPLVAFLILMAAGEGQSSYASVFFLSLLPGLLVLFLIRFKVREVLLEKREEDVFPSFREGWRKLGGSYHYYILLVFLFSLGNSSDMFLLLRSREFLAPELIPLLWAGLNLSRALFSIPGGWLSDLCSRKVIIGIGWLIYGAVYFGFALNQSPFWLWILMSLYGAYFGLTEGAEKALVADLAPSRMRGTAFGLFHLAWGGAALPASLLVGGIWMWVGHAWAFSMGAVLSFLAVLGLIFLRVAPPEEA